MPAPLFILFGALTLCFAVAVIVNRNPVTAALCLVVSFIGLAGLFVGLNAFFIGIVQILVYAGAVMVLFIFIIMLMDIEKEEKKRFEFPKILVAALIGFGLTFQVVGALWELPNGNLTAEEVPLDYESAVNLRTEPWRSKTATAALEEGRLPDAKLIGEKLFSDYNLHLQMIGVLLLIATVGVVALSRRDSETGIVDQAEPDDASDADDTDDAPTASADSPQPAPAE